MRIAARPARWIAVMAALLLVALAGWYLSARWVERRAAGEADRSASEAARGDAGLLDSELQKYRLLPLVLADYPDVIAALRDRSPAGRRAVDERLELLAARTDAAAIYLLDRGGVTVAASNWRLPASFVGQDYGFRPYYRDAMRSGASELFALGTVSGRPGLYLARRIDAGGAALGVIVVKVEFAAVERGWAARRDRSLVIDRHGVILITSEPGWRFATTRALGAADAAAVRRSLQFGSRPLRAAPLALHGAEAWVPGNRRERFRLAAVPVSLAGATLLHLEPLRPALAAASASARAWTLAVLIALLAAATLWWRARERRLLQQQARRLLEAEVAHRTAELSDANAALTQRSREREEADRRYRAAREELAQANRLASLGQITAGVAHEINQPVAAIRTFAENAALLIERGDAARAGSNMAQVVALTERIGAITAGLRGYARRRTPENGRIALPAVLDGALLLAGDRVRDMTRVDLPAAARSVHVLGDKVRLEQIVLNLLQNAAEALAGRPAPRIDVALSAGAAADGEWAVLTVADNGPGVDPAIADALFVPFVSGKPAGLGLGLGIARDIAREFGGTLDWRPGPDGGAVFALRLRRA